MGRRQIEANCLVLRHHERVRLQASTNDSEIRAWKSLWMKDRFTWDWERWKNWREHEEWSDSHRFLFVLISLSPWKYQEQMGKSQVGMCHLRAVTTEDDISLPSSNALRSVFSWLLINCSQLYCYIALPNQLAYPAYCLYCSPNNSRLI